MARSDGRHPMKVAVQISRARFDGRGWRVIRPERGTHNATLIDCGGWRELFIDRRSAYQLGVLWLLAARSRRTVIHLPLRGGRQPAEPAFDGTRLDLVLTHHTVQLRASLWPRLRSALGPARPHTVRIPSTDMPDPDTIDYMARHRRENADLLHERIHADTLFLTGSAPVFRETADRFLDIAFRAPGSAPGEETPHHCCTEFHEFDGILRNSGGIHVQYHARWLPSRPAELQLRSAR
ncbi:hypothetical protein SAMN05216215_100766 [Saccharopolyspora shandongensis]|uniref:Uncharacterized protein n=1 Tax=Saccharopolyspora shandongensis TaxID=418495 RepID=A0A1H2YM18_9PSEU|nr:hypothetical protein [Saccharopolyspora shandongensis]SDX05579.1 hypothetical protein SAMN05216215_100766 [Saccharopolyspora shandongensis]